jgi:lysophospholipase L1-like esterase
MTQKRMWVILVLLLAAGLAVSLYFNYDLYRRSRHYYVQLNGVHIDPLGLSHFPTAESQPVRLRAGQQLVVFYGDSRAAEWEAPAGLSERFRFMNRAVHGETAVQAALRFPYHARPMEPDILIVQVGANDLKTIPLFPQQEEQIIANCKDSLARIVAQARAMGAMVVLTTVFPLGQVPPERYIVWSPEVAEGINEVNAFIHSLAGEGVVVMDAGPILVDGDGRVRAEYSFDLLHLNEAGYMALNVELARVLADLPAE